MVWTADAFLQKRYQAGRTEARSEILKFLEEHPDATAAELREFLLKDYNPNRRSGGVQ